MQEKCINIDCMKADICSGVRLIVDMQGASTYDVEQSDISISKLLNSEFYERIEGTYTFDDINEWDKRTQHFITNFTKRRLIEAEKVIYYTAEDGSEEIVIGKLYVEMKLENGKTTGLIQKAKLLQEIVGKYVAVNPFIKIDNIYLIQKNQIICKNLSELYSCFDAKTFGDVRMGVGDYEITFTEFHSSSLLGIEEYDLNIEKSVVKGLYNETEAYMGELNFSVSCQAESNHEYSYISNLIDGMNKTIFNVFKENITDSFCEKLLNEIIEDDRRCLDT